MALQQFNRELCRQFLSGAIKYPLEVLPLCDKLTERDFDPDANRIIYSALKACIASDPNAYSEYVLIDRLNALGVKIGGAIEPALYVQSLLGLGVNAKAAITIAKQIGRVSLRRELYEAARKAQELVEEDASSKEPLKASELVAQFNGTINEKINLLEGNGDNEPKDLYKSIDAFLNEGNTFETNSLTPPFRLYQDLWGNFDPASIYCLCARLKVGKSSFALSLLQQMALMQENGNMQALVLDTEMSTEEVQSRIISSLSGVKEFYIRHKLYKKQKHMRDKVDEAYEKMRPIWNKIHHICIAGWSLESQMNAVRRWHAKHVRDKDARGIVALDYFKLSSNTEFTGKTPRDVVLGYKVDQYKCLTKELQIPLISFVQANREGEDSKQGNRIQNSSVIAGSDMIAAFVSNMYLLERLSPEQRAVLCQLGPGSATHSLRIVAPRQQGPNELGNDKLVEYKDEKGKTRWCENYLLLAMDNFVFKEIGMFSDVYSRAKSTPVVQKEIDKSGADLL